MQPYVGQNYPGGSREPSSGFGAAATMPNNSQMAPAAQRMSQMGRNGDSMLMHMAPEEVRGLQQLAIAHGGSLTINPETGLYEASFLKNLLPTLIGAGLMFIPGVNALAAAAMVGGGYGIAKGDLKAGLMAGLQAYGGASLFSGIGASMLGQGATAATAAAPTAASNIIANASTDAIINAAPAAAGISGAGTLGANAATVGASGLTQSAANAAALGVPQAAAAGASGLTQSAANAAALGGISPAAAAAPIAPVATAAPTISLTPPPPAPTLGQRFNQTYGNFNNAAAGATKANNYTPVLHGIPAKAAGYAATTGLTSGIGSALTPDMSDDGDVSKDKYAPYEEYELAPREVSYMTPGQGSREQLYFSKPVFRPKRKPTPVSDTFDINQGYAAGGVSLKDGSFIVDARTVSELGNGSSRAGQDILARHGGQPIRGRGDGVSDSIRANIGGVQEARVARDEVKFDPRAVSRMGGGNPKQGAQKLYALMDRAKQARKHADRGEDTKLRGLMAAR